MLGRQNGSQIGRRRLVLTGLVLLAVVARHQSLDHHALVGIVGERELAFHHGLDQLRRRIACQHLRGTHGQGIEWAQLGFEHRIFGDALGVKLAVNPLLQSQGPNLLDIARPRAEGQAIQGLLCFLVVGDRLSELGRFRRYLFLGICRNAGQ